MNSDVLTVLVADDEPQMRAVVARHMKNRGFDVLEASDGEEAVAMAEGRVPDLVLLDVMMPQMSGWEVAKKLRADDTFSHTAIVILTGIGERLNAITSALTGVDASLDKPFQFGELDATVDAVLQRHGKQVGAKKAPAKKAPAKKAPAKKAPAKKAPAKKAPAKKAPAKKAPAKKAPAKKAPAKKGPAKKAPAKKGPAKKAPAKKAPAKKALAKKTSAKKKA